jgi:hypothetical protein
VITTTQSYNAALSACQARGTGWSLSEVTSSSENSFVQGLIGGAESWLGGTDRAVEGAWRWESGAEFWSGGSTGGPVGGSFTNFVSGEPNNAGGTGAVDCLRMIGSGQWRDIGCDSAFTAVCESDTGPTCFDGTQNGNETGVDCGGSCAPCGGGCAAGQSEFGGHCYQVITTAQTFDGALSACQSRGSGWTLAVITSLSENSFVQGLLGGADHWLGGTDRAVEGSWVWQSGAEFWSGGSTGGPVAGSFTNFLGGEPNNAGGTGAADCLRMIGTGQWRDAGCDSVFRAVCESSAF